jgi:hypothetical protein
MFYIMPLSTVRIFCLCLSLILFDASAMNSGASGREPWDIGEISNHDVTRQDRDSRTIHLFHLGLI